jgi:hypothetical protein
MTTSGRDAAVGAVTSMPTLAEIVADATKATGLTRPVLGGLLIELAALQTQLGAAIASAPDGAALAPPDRALTIEQVAERLNLSPATMKRWLRREPYSAAVVVRSRTCVRVSAQRLEDILLRGGTKRSRR